MYSKKDVISAITYILEVSPEALKIPDIESYHCFMFTLFEFEEQFGLTIDKIDDIICLYLDKENSSIYLATLEMLNEWYKKKIKFENGAISIAKYTYWKLNYPQSSKNSISSKMIKEK